MYLTDYREKELQDVVEKFDVELFRKVTGKNKGKAMPYLFIRLARCIKSTCNFLNTTYDNEQIFVITSI